MHFGVLCVVGGMFDTFPSTNDPTNRVCVQQLIAQQYVRGRAYYTSTVQQLFVQQYLYVAVLLLERPTPLNVPPVAVRAHS